MKTTIGQNLVAGLFFPLIGKPKAPIFLINGPLIRQATINFAKQGACGAVGSYMAINSGKLNFKFQRKARIN